MKTLLKVCLWVFISLFSLLVCAGVAWQPTRMLIMVTLFPPTVIEVGDKMVDTKLLDIDGNKKHLSDYMSNKYMLLCFYSTGCGPCINSVPELKEVSEMYSENLTLIDINLDTERYWKKSMEKRNNTWANLRDPKSHAGIAAKYGNDLGVPYFVIISPEGKVVDRWNGYRNELIKEKMSENILNKITLIQ